MKIKNLILALLLLCSLTNYSQITKKNWMLGGDLSLDLQDEIGKLEDGTKTSYKTFHILTDANVGYFIVDKLAFGAKGRLEGIKFIDGYEPSKLNYAYSVGPFMRYYILDSSKLMNVFVEVSYLTTTSIFNSTDNKKHKYSHPTYYAKAGTSIFLNDIISIDLSLQYSKMVRASNSITNDIIFGAGFQLFLTKK